MIQATATIIMATKTKFPKLPKPIPIGVTSSEEQAHLTESLGQANHRCGQRTSGTAPEQCAGEPRSNRSERQSIGGGPVSTSGNARSSAELRPMSADAQLPLVFRQGNTRTVL